MLFRSLFDKAVHQATLLQGAAQRSNDQSARAMAKLQDLSEKLPGEVAAAVSGKLEAAAKRAADQMAQKWAEADAAAASAAAVYRHAESRFTWKLVACIGSGVVATGAVLVVSPLYSRTVGISYLRPAAP